MYQALKSALILTILTLTLFFGLYFAFSLNGSISNKQYYNYSIFICCFIVLPLYAIFCFYTIFKLSKTKAKTANNIDELMTFKEGFKEGFLTVFFAGIFTLTFIFIFFNTYGMWAQDSLKDGILETFMSNMPDDADHIKNIENTSVIKSANLFSVRNYFGLLSIFLSFYIIISALFSQFLKKRVY